MGSDYRIQTSDDGADALLDGWARRYSSALKRFFQRRAPATVEADDLVQEVFVRLARRADLSEIAEVEGYLFQAANSVLADRFRRDAVRERGAHDSFEEERHGEAGLDPERVLLGRESVELLIAALYELPERTRHVFALYHFDQFRHAEIAARLGIAVSTVEKHMARANAHLLARLGRKKQR